MRVAVVTAYGKESASQLRRCVDAVAAQTYAVTHLLVADGAPQDWVDRVDGLRHLHLDRPRPGFPLAPLAIGAARAAGEQFDALAVVNPQDVPDPDYVQECLATAEREHSLHFVLVEAHDAEPSPPAGGLFVLRRGFPALPGLALIPAPLAGLGTELILERFRILDYHGVATPRPLFTPAPPSRPTLAEIRAWWDTLQPDQQRLIEANVGGTMSFTGPPAPDGDD